MEGLPPAPEVLEIKTIEGFEELHPDIQEGLQRLDFTEEHRSLVEKLVAVSKLISRYLDHAESEDRLLSDQEIEELYELQNVLFSNKDLEILASPLFGSQHLDAEGNVDHDTWFWKLVNPLSEIPHLKQANVQAGRVIASLMYRLPKESINIFEGGKGGGKTAIAVTEALITEDIADITSYVGAEIAPSLVEHSRSLLDGNMPDYIQGDEAREAAFRGQHAVFEALKAKRVLQGDIAKIVPTLGDSSQDAIIFSYVIHHLKCGEALIRAIVNKRIRMDKNSGFHFYPSVGEPIQVERRPVRDVIYEAVGGDPRFFGHVLDMLQSDEEIDEQALRDIIHNNQLELLKTCYKKLQKGGLIIIADPEEGKSNFNKSVIIKDAEGLADFTSCEQMLKMLYAAGFLTPHAFVQWEITKECYEANEEILTMEYNVVPKSFDGGKTVLGYIVAVPFKDRAQFEQCYDTGIVDKHLGYFVIAMKSPDAIEDLIDDTRRELLYF